MAPEARNGAGLDEISDAIESGAGLPSVARAAAKALDASVALIDRSSAVLAVAAVSSAEEGRLLDGGEQVETIELRVADEVVGELRYRARGEAIPAGTLRMVGTLLSLEVERARASEWASDEAAADFVASVLERRLTGGEPIVAAAQSLGTDLSDGAGVVIARAVPHTTQSGEWRARILILTLRAVRSTANSSLAAVIEGESLEVAAIVPTTDADRLGKAAADVFAELARELSGFTITVGHSRPAERPEDLYKAGKEALIAVNVAEAEGESLLAFEETGSYRLLLGAMSEDPAELQRFYAETVEPLSAYDDQYETELLKTVEAYLDCDGSVTPTAEQLFTHRHTVRYRLERIKELSGHDLSSTEGRERLGLGLKAMRVLGIPGPRGPAMEPGAKGGKAK